MQVSGGLQHLSLCDWPLAPRAGVLKVPPRVPCQNVLLPKRSLFQLNPQTLLFIPLPINRHCGCCIWCRDTCHLLCVNSANPAPFQSLALCARSYGLLGLGRKGDGLVQPLPFGALKSDAPVISQLETESGPEA